MTSSWRQIYNEWEKIISPPLEQVAESNEFRDLIAVGTKITRSALDHTEQASRRWLHLWNLPAAGDIRHLRQQIAGLEREVQILKFQLDDARRKSAATPAATSSNNTTATNASSNGRGPKPNAKTTRQPK